MTNRIVCCLTISLLLGILFEREKSLWLLTGMTALLLYTGIVTAGKQEKAWRIILLRSTACMLSFGCGAVHGGSQARLQDNLETLLQEGDKITVWGEVSKKEEKSGKYLYYLKDTRILVGDIVYPGYGILVEFSPFRLGAEWKHYNSDMHIQPGNILKVNGEYASFQIPRNEGNFNEKQYYQSKKIGFRLYALEKASVYGKGSRYAAFLEKLRQNLKDVYLRCMSEKDAGLMADMTLGDKSLLESEVKELYQKAGISHILAISGLHVSLFGMGIFRLLQKCSCPGTLSAMLSGGIVWSFGMLSGMEISTKRAVFMFFLMMAARILGYSYDSVTALSVSAFLQLWENPFVLEYAGFLFSYSAVLGVTVVSAVVRKSFWQKKPGERKTKEEKRWIGLWKQAGAGIGNTLFVSFCIQTTALPLTLWFYYEVPCYSVIVNGCILPFLGVLLSMGVFGALAGWMCPRAGVILLTPVGWMLRGNEWICQKFSSLPGAVWILGKPKIQQMILYYLILIVILWLLWKGKGRKWLTGLCIGLIFLTAGEKPQFEIAALDVGQGDGIFIGTKEGEYFFLDGGSSDVNQVGKYRILPFLKSRGISSITGWIVSHADMDHVSGLKELLEGGYEIKYLIVAENSREDEAQKELSKLAEKAGCEIVSAAPGMQFGTSSAVFTVLHPDNLQERGGTWDRNENSLVISLKYQNFTALFTGDIGTEQEERLLREQKVGSVDFYKAAHHGSNGSNSQEFLKALSPRLTVISCGKRNSYGHPGKEALERMRRIESAVYCTMNRGQISVKADNGNIQVQSVLPEEN
ncbi:MAG: DNA internalization-related competence protein ComEC/Rec2 [Lachnospiraceae bacterium]|nr:DNA internalization-related competence protein ComEC/Rec2 [Lachnospiraceae bacterium]